ncbi:hypothetical protein Poli38472_004663 [Pythium oligandrum]|uniref:Uncharacterized protein n=1 Tax=Pythium oligandrum TaxID=41045 RepID=A0A8K1FG38_PYTOL|nr:hypothetical protein Poli38472_004663 [Pythium oligandrum]|eukprot:TMW59594.1 hypothetical protein Poli38472_004663 [Pythium oligandrum]
MYDVFSHREARVNCVESVASEHFAVRIALGTRGEDNQKRQLVVWVLSEISGRCFHVPFESKVSSTFFKNYGERFQNGMSLLANAIPEQIPLVAPVVKELIVGSESALGTKTARAIRLHSMIDQLELSDGGVKSTNENHTLAPAESYNLLQKLLREHDEHLTTHSISTMTNLECATLNNGKAQWAHRQEHMSRQNRLRIDHVSATVADNPLLTSPASTASTTSITSSKRDPPKYYLCDFVVSGLSEVEDWRLMYCSWELVDQKQSVVLESGQTIQNPHENPQQQSFWLQSFVLKSVVTVAQLRECELVVTLKRPSRLPLRKSDRHWFC